MQPSTPSRHAGPSSGQESTQKTPTQASVSGQVRDPFATPRAPGPSGPVTRGGAVIKGHKKTGHGIEDVYPKAFLPLCRASFMKVADLETLRIVFTWQNDPDSPGARQATYTKNIIDREVRKIILVYSSNKLMCSLIKTLFPDVNTSSQTFNQYRTYAMTTFSNFKHEILWQNSYVRLFFLHSFCLGISPVLIFYRRLLFAGTMTLATPSSLSTQAKVIIARLLRS